MTKLYLFVWTNVFADYTSGMGFAIAENEKEAVDMLIKKHGCYCSEYAGERYECDNHKDLRTVIPKVHELTERVCYAVSGGG